MVYVKDSVTHAEVGADFAAATHKGTSPLAIWIKIYNLVPNESKSAVVETVVLGILHVNVEKNA